MAGAFSISAITGAAHEAVETASRIADMAERVGISAEAVQRLQFAAEQSGGSFEAIATSMRVMSDRLVDGKLPKALTDMGLSLAQLRGMSLDQAFTTIADSIAKIKDPMLQSATAVDIFGRGAQQIMPAIKAGFSEVGAAAPLMMNQIVSSLDASGDSWARMQTQIGNLKAEALEPLLATFMAFPASVQTAALGIGQLAPSLEGIAIAILAAGGPVAAVDMLWASLSLLAAPVAVMAGIGAIGFKLQELARQAIESGSAVGNLISKSLGAGELRPGLIGPKRTTDIALPNDSVAGSGIGNLLDQGPKLQKVLAATKVSTEGLDKSTKALDKSTLAAAQSAHEYQAMLSWARNEQGLYQMKLDEQAMKLAKPLLSSNGGMDRLRALMGGPLDIGGSQGVSQEAMSSGKSFGAMFSEGFKTSISDLLGGKGGGLGGLLGGILGGGGGGGGLGGILGGILGGGGGGGGLSGLLGGLLGGGGGLGGLLGGLLGGGGRGGDVSYLQMGAMFGPIGAGVGALVDGIVKKGLFRGGEESLHVNKPRDAYLSQFASGGMSGFDALAARLTQITGQAGGGDAFNILNKADTVDKFDAAVTAITAILERGGGFTPQGAAASGAGGADAPVAPVVNNTFNVQVMLEARYVTTEDEWIRNQVTAGCLAAINENANGAFTTFESLVDQALPQVIPGAFTPVVEPA